MPCVIALHGIWPQPFQPFRWCGLNLPWLQMVHILTQRDVKGIYGWTWEWDFFTNTNNGNGWIWNFHRIVPLYIYIYLFFAIFYHILCTPGLKEDYIILWMDKILQLVTVGHHEARFTNPTGPTWGIPVFQPFKCGVAVFGRCDLSGPMAEICRNESGKWFLQFKCGPGRLWHVEVMTMSRYQTCQFTRALVGRALEQPKLFDD